jgi:hypothetical protein
VAAALAGLHLALVIHGASNLNRSRFEGPFGAALNWYAALSGADHHYAFFAPDVSPELRTTFVLSDGAGRTWTDSLEGGASGEARVRLSCVVVQAPWDRVPASWAETMFARHPAAVRIVVRVEEHVLPTLRQYRAGQRSHWRPVHEAAFRRDS